MLERHAVSSSFGVTPTGSTSTGALDLFASPPVATGGDMDAHTAWSDSDREQVPPSLVVSARLQLGAGPRSDPARSQKPTRNPWMGLSVPGVGIHGTSQSLSVGYSVSHGCIRMKRRDAESLFRLVRVGTRVWIV